MEYGSNASNRQTVSTNPAPFSPGVVARSFRPWSGVCTHTAQSAAFHPDTSVGP
ncbi:unnamed protein product [Eretmochelys imbricata]